MVSIAVALAPACPVTAVPDVGPVLTPHPRCAATRVPSGLNAANNFDQALHGVLLCCVFVRAAVIVRRRAPHHRERGRCRPRGWWAGAIATELVSYTRCVVRGGVIIALVTLCTWIPSFRVWMSQNENDLDSTFVFGERY
jgi:hypothetical protein